MIIAGSHTAACWCECSADQALPRLIQEYGQFVRRVCAGVCEDEDLIDDLAQEVFIRAYRSWDGFEGRSRVSTWLYTIARRTCFRYLRRRAGEPRTLADIDQLVDRVSDTGPAARSVLPAADPLEEMIGAETADFVRLAVADLPIRYRLPLVLKEFLGLTVEELAEVLHLSEGTVKSRLFRARALLEPDLSAALEGGRRRPPDRPAGRLSRSDTLCPNCRHVFHTEIRASRACAALLEGDESSDLRAIIAGELGRAHVPTT